MNGSLTECIKSLVREVVAEELQRALAEHNGKQPELLLLDTNQVAKKLSLPPSWVATAARQGNLKSVKCGHHVRFRLSDIQAFIEEKNDE